MTQILRLILRSDTQLISSPEGSAEPSRMHRTSTCAYHKAPQTFRVTTQCHNIFNHRLSKKQTKQNKNDLDFTPHTQVRHTSRPEGSCEPSRMHKTCTCAYHKAHKTFRPTTQCHNILIIGFRRNRQNKIKMTQILRLILRSTCVSDLSMRRKI